MFKRALGLLSLLPLCLVAACSAPAGENTASGQEDLGIIKLFPLTVTGLSVAPTDTQLSISFAIQGVLSGAPTGTVTLTGGGTTMTAEGLTEVTFTGLQPCTAYTYAIAYSTSGTLASGGANTYVSPGVACPNSETIRSTLTRTFRGVNHQEAGVFACKNHMWNNFPLGTAWIYNESIGGQTANVGAYHYNDPGTDPFPCTESLVDSSRARFEFTLSPLQLARLTDAQFVASYGNEYGTEPCAMYSEIVNVMRTPVPASSYSATSANGDTWPSALGGPLTTEFLQFDPGTSPGPWKVIAANGKMSIDYGKLTNASLTVGLEQQADGLDIVNNAFAQDNNSCTSTLTGVGLALTYAELPPDSPLGCVWTSDCYADTITCNNSADAFTLARVYPATVVSAAVINPFESVQGTTAGGTITMSTVYDANTVYQVCTSTTAGDAVQSCVSLPTPATRIACVEPPPSGGGGGGGTPPPHRGPVQD